MGSNARLDRTQLLHQLLVDVKAPCCVEDDRVEIVGAGVIDRFNADFRRLFLGVEDRHVDRVAQNLQLFDCGGTIDVRRDQKRAELLFLVIEANLPQSVVFPDPCKPQTTSLPGVEPNLSGSFSEPSRITS